MRAALVLALALAAFPALAESGQSGVWTYVYEPGAGGSGGLVTALAPAPAADRDDPSRLVVRCMNGRAEVLVGGAGGWGLPRRSLEVTVAIDGLRPETSLWDVSTDGRAVFFAGDAEAFLKQLPDDAGLRVSLVDATGQRRENMFSTKGFDAVREKLAKACAWKEHPPGSG
ncbi:hypothetical protein [Methylopila sp. M107]|uniref:hypothetical protein n=1 Tax=Methylopila sp. M107 TaxID=1101190 RepID=UPI00037A53B3|nr:hypothetical protein [Methylopila sp. M107]